MAIFPFGTRFTIKICEEQETWVVHETNSNPNNGIISSASPLGHSLIQGLGAYKTPGGESVKYELLQVEIENETYERPFLEVINNIWHSSIQTSFQTPYLNEQDILLAQKWLDLPEFKLFVDITRLREWKFKDDNPLKWEYSRVLSARAAEKVALEFYRRYGQIVEDVSIRQVSDNSSSDWIHFDLLANNQPVDVKNSRKSRYNPNSYVEHCVPKFKQNRHKQDITVAGILSPNLWPEILLFPQTASHDVDIETIFLGTTSIRDIEALQDHFNKDNFFQLVFNRSQNGSNLYLPPWIFQYPDFVYSSRFALMDRISNLPLPEPDRCRPLHINPIPLLLSAGIDPNEYWKNFNFQKWEQSFIRKILAWRTQNYFSLPALFLSILTHFLEMVSSSENVSQNYLPRNYYKFIFTGFNPSEIQNPLLIYDPLYTISSLIASLDTMWTVNHTDIQRYRIFKLQNLNILKGRYDQSDGQWKTLIAYCGGWIRGQGKCGETPLVLGQSKQCAECGRLICPRCGYCSQSCSSISTSKLETYPKSHKLTNL